MSVTTTEPGATAKRAAARKAPATKANPAAVAPAVTKTTLKKAAAPAKAVAKKTTPARKPAAKTPPAVDHVAVLLKVLNGQVGYREGYSGGHWNNDEKFAAQVPGLAWANGQPWCATFVSWAVMTADLAAFYPRTASTDAGAAWFKDRGDFSQYPAVGAQVFYGHGGDMVHTGIVIDFDATTITTIEGNTNDSGSSEGDGVYRKVRQRRDTFVQGYGIPAIPGVKLRSADPAYKPVPAPASTTKPAKAPRVPPHVAAAQRELDKVMSKDPVVKAQVAKAQKHLDKAR